MLKEKVQELQIEVSRLRNSDKANASINLIEALQHKVAESDKHLRMTLDRLTDEHMKCQRLESILQKKEDQVVSSLEVAERVCTHLLNI